MSSSHLRSSSLFLVGGAEWRACGLHRLCARVLADGCQFRSAETFDYAGSGLYPLHLAVASGSAATVQVLAEAGFNVHQRNASGATPIGAAVQTGQLDLVEVRATPTSTGRPFA